VYPNQINEDRGFSDIAPNMVILLFLLHTIILCILVKPVTSLYFYLEGSEQKCFLEELPLDTLVVGTYKAEEWSETQQQYIENPQLGIQITVEELPHKNRIVNINKGASRGRFTFTAAESGDHAICLNSNTSEITFRYGHWRNN
jgi:hypothetical protein